jgi:hypothetical protein
MMVESLNTPITGIGKSFTAENKETVYLIPGMDDADASTASARQASSAVEE